ncbi:MAG: toxin-antitoxin system YwqK family antitoxin [Hyphomicrobiales bacterium]
MNRVILFLLSAIIISACNSTTKETEFEQVIVERYPGGEPKVVQYFEVFDGKRSLVKEESFYSCGKRMTSGKLSDNLRTGTWESYYKNGAKWTDAVYVKGINHGPANHWHENGKLYYKGQYKNGKRAGKWSFFDKEGHLLKEINYDKK